MAKRERILEQIRGGIPLPKDALVGYIKNRDVTLEEMKAAGLSSDKVAEIEQCLNNDETNLWSAVDDSNLESLRKYLSESLLRTHEQEAKDKIAALEAQRWESVQDAPTKKSLEEYKTQFPDGQHIAECDELLSDLPWLETLKDNTIEAYEDYMNKYPGKHDSEAESAINSIRDDEAWNQARNGGRTRHFRKYLEDFPNGKHASNARAKIAMRANDDQYLEALENDPNAQRADDIQTMVNTNTNTIDWQDIEEIFGEEKTKDIRNYQVIQIQGHQPPVRISSPTTEVYFWGTPGSGKTCALGTLLSSARANGILNAISIADDYGESISNLYVSGQCCYVQEGTPITEMHEIPIELKDGKGLWHKMSLIDLAGEIFLAAYEFRHGTLVPGSERERLLNKVMGYLNDKRNRKIHFFIVEYGAENKPWGGKYMHQYLENMIAYLQETKVLDDITDGVYVLVTKCDKAPQDDKQQAVEQYVQGGPRLAGFWTAITEACGRANIRDLAILPFSIGEVFAQRLCYPDQTYTNGVIDKLLEKTHPTKSGCWFINWLNN